MATLVLQAAGAALGSLFGPLGATIGGAVGALAGYAVDQTLFGQHVEGARLSDLDVQRSQEGVAIPRLYGRARIAGQVIWATQFEEVTEESGGKGGPSVTSYSYYANFAVGLCEGPVARIGRVWADGKLLDMTDILYRLHPGGEDETVDSLIAAKQGATLSPAYRGTAMIVFERLPVADYGNRLPQLSFELFRPVRGIEAEVQAVVIIPGASEFAYDPAPVYCQRGPGARETLNRHVDGAATDWAASLDQLQALCPRLSRAALTIAWFGDDLRAGSCSCAPRVETAATVSTPPWRVAGLDRAAARRVSTVDGRPAYGGTPSDAGVIRALRDLSERGLAVTFYPLLMMDIPAGGDQPAYPWRGMITGTDGSAVAAAEIAAFVGSAAPSDFALSGGAVVYSGPDEWSYRRFVLHGAMLAKAAGGVDTFLIGSEMRGLTTLRDAAGAYPFVAALRALAADVREILGPATKLTYAADWSEYFGHQPADGSGDVFFHLDPLWADANIDAVGIDLYAPLSDWRDGIGHLDAAIADSSRDTAYLRSRIAGGEGFDWYYASDADRIAQIRSPISDGAAGKPWVYRYKDLFGWWSNTHFDRPGGIETATPTAWLPQGKPIWFTELGCPAIDKGANQPNVFPDPKVGGARLPHFSDGARDALVQDRMLAAEFQHWDQDNPAFDPSRNPLSGVYDGRMVPADRIHLWSWDARPFPAFPLRTDVWADGGNWQTGHWLNGRLGAPTTLGLVAQILADYGIADAVVGDLDAKVDGFVIGRLGSARQALQALADALGFEAAETATGLRFIRPGLPRREIEAAALAEEDPAPVLSIRRAQETELPAEIDFGFVDGLDDYRDRTVASRRLETPSRRQLSLDSGLVTDGAVALALADDRLQQAWQGREIFTFALDPRALDLEPADVVTLRRDDGRETPLLITRIEDGAARRIEARALDPGASGGGAGTATGTVALPADPGPPALLLMDLPSLTGVDEPVSARVALFADPWPGPFGLSAGSAESGYRLRQTLTRRAVMGELTAPLGAGPIARLDRAAVVELRLYGGALQALPLAAMLNGGNVAAIGSEADGFELVQFADAALVGDNLWRLATLLRGQGGTEDRADSGHAAGSHFILLDGATPLLNLDPSELGLERTWRAGPARLAYDADRFVEKTLALPGRARWPLPPVHLRATKSVAGDLSLGWIRQTRIGGDGWEPAEVPLGEAAESYRVEFWQGGVLCLSRDVSAPALAVDAATLAAALAPGAFTVRVAQLSATVGPGLATEIDIDG